MNIFLSGYGKMGHMVQEIAVAKGWNVVGHADIDCPENYETAPKADVCIDFSGVGAQKALAAYIRRTKTPLLSGTTGLTEPDFDVLRDLSKEVPVIWTANYSTGVAVLKKLLREYAPVLCDWDREIVELHHNQKVDAPSGTAKMLFSAIQEVRPDAVAHCGRAGEGKREKNEIGISALRMGGIVGIHEVHICTQNQMLTLRHEAMDRGMLADGGVAAARFLAGRSAGLYNMESILEG